MTTDLREAGSRPRTKLEELFALFRRQVELEVKVLLPATVTKFIPPVVGPHGPLPAMVEVLIDQLAARPGRPGDIDPTSVPPEVFKPESGSLDGRGELVGPYPLLTCPVDWGGTPSMWGPREYLPPGTGGKVEFTDRALGRWLVAFTGVPVDPGEGATHGENLCDAFFRPGLRSGPKTLLGPASVPALGEGAVLGPEDGTAELAFSLLEARLTTTAPALVLDGSVEVQVGAGAVDAIAKADPIVEILTALAADIAGWVPVTEAALKASMMLPTGTVGKILALAAQIAALKGKVV